MIPPVWHFYGNPASRRVSAIALKELKHNHLVLVFVDEDSRTHECSIDHLIKHDVPLHTADALLCVHGRRILPQRVLDSYLMGGYNVHPYLREYPGADPIGRALADGNREASVCAHRMTERVDDPSLIVAERRIVIPREKFVSRGSVYKVLYPLYRQVVQGVIAKVDEQVMVLRKLTG